MRLIDTLLAFPSLILALAIVGSLGAGAVNLAIAAAVYCVPQFARIMRATVLSLINADYVSAARVAGGSSTRIALRHLLPNAVAPLIVQTTYAIAAVILVTSGLSFLGLGVQPPSPEWGAMLSRGRDYLRSDPHIVMIPGIVIAVFILALNLVGDGLRKLLDPRTRGS
jgi:peptide/nickel transport system permease protein